MTRHLARMARLAGLFRPDRHRVHPDHYRAAARDLIPHPTPGGVEAAAVALAAIHNGDPVLVITGHRAADALTVTGWQAYAGPGPHTPPAGPTITREDVTAMLSDALHLVEHTDGGRP